MGIESYSFLLLANQVEVKIENTYCKLKGVSQITVKEIEKYLGILCKKKKNIYLFKKILDVYILESNGHFQGIEVKGCLSCFSKGIEESFNFYQLINEAIPVDICITENKEKFNNFSEFKERMLSENIDKINIFQKQYGNKEFNISSRDFYKLIKRKNMLNKYFPLYKYLFDRSSDK